MEQGGRKGGQTFMPFSGPLRSCTTSTSFLLFTTKAPTPTCRERHKQRDVRESGPRKCSPKVADLIMHGRGN